MKHCVTCNARLLVPSWRKCQACTPAAKVLRGDKKYVYEGNRMMLQYTCPDCDTVHTRGSDTVLIHPETCDTCHRAKVLAHYRRARD